MFDLNHGNVPALVASGAVGRFRCATPPDPICFYYISSRVGGEFKADHQLHHN